MTDDVLAPFVDAYRDAHSARSLDRRSLRQRVVAAAGRRRVRRTERLRLLLSFAATFAGSVALAASPPVREHVRDAFSFVRVGVVARADAGARGLPRSAARARVAAVPSELVAATPRSAAPAEVRSVASLPLEPAPVPVERPVIRRATPPAPVSAPAPVLGASAAFELEPPALAPPSKAPPPVAATIPGADLALYRHAHELHFGGADRARALAAWDAYLKAFPAGTFAPEARLNRAVCLAKLGRKSEAEDVLVDIERGRFGKDGRRQARKILGALEDD